LHPSAVPAIHFPNLIGRHLPAVPSEPTTDLRRPLHPSAVPAILAESHRQSSSGGTVKPNSRLASDFASFGGASDLLSTSYAVIN
jgi:hypothetical protein